MKYLIYDTALNGLSTLLVLQKYYAVNRSLFQGTKDEVLMDVSPWLFQIDDRLEENLGNEGTVSMEFVLSLDCPGDLNMVSNHLKKFIYQTIEGREYFFRFYDPRVLEKFLPTCDRGQLIEFFGPVKYFTGEGASAKEAIRFSQANGVLQQQPITTKT